MSHTAVLTEQLHGHWTGSNWFYKCRGIDVLKNKETEKERNKLGEN